MFAQKVSRLPLKKLYRKIGKLVKNSTQFSEKIGKFENLENFKCYKFPIFQFFRVNIEKIGKIGNIHLTTIQQKLSQEAAAAT